MKEVKVSELEGKALDWAVAQAEGVGTIMMSPRKGEPKKAFALFGSLALSVGGEDETSYAPSTCWHCGGPLIEKHRPMIAYHEGHDRSPMATMPSTHPAYESGDTVLIAACRAIVAAKLGDVVKIPDELEG